MSRDFDLIKTGKNTLHFFIIFCLLIQFIFFDSFPASASNLPIQTMFSAPQTLQTPLFIGLTFSEKSPFEFNFLINDFQKCDENCDPADIQKLIQYFLTAVTIPEQDLWVNLSPYEKDKVIPDSFGQTNMGRDLLIQDYFLKKLSSALMHPENEIGSSFWNYFYQQIYQDGLLADKAVSDIFYKIWIVPGKVELVEHQKGVLIWDMSLDVLLADDYLNNIDSQSMNHSQQFDSQKSMNYLKKSLLPKIREQINQSEVFGNLRQIYSAVILSNWFKQKLEQNWLNQFLGNNRLIDGMKISDSISVDDVYQKYLTVLKQNANEMIREEYDPVNQEMVVRKYFSGGAQLDQIDKASLKRRVSESEVNEFLKEIAPQKFHVDFAELNDDSSDDPDDVFQYDYRSSTNSGGVAEPVQLQVEEDNFPLQEESVAPTVAVVPNSPSDKKISISPTSFNLGVDGIFAPLMQYSTKENDPNSSFFDWGIGDFSTAKKMIEFASQMGYDYVQWLPIVMSEAFHSPYSPVSHFLLDVKYVGVPDFVNVLESMSLDTSDYVAFYQNNIEEIQHLKNESRIDNDRIFRLKVEAMQKVWQAFQSNKESEIYIEFQEFRKYKNQELQNIYQNGSKNPFEQLLLSVVLKDKYFKLNQRSGWDWRTWSQYEPGLTEREPEVIQKVLQENQEQINFQAFLQFVLHRQLYSLQKYAKEKNVAIMTDTPFAPAIMDIWLQNQIVELDPENNYQRKTVQGVPGKASLPFGQFWQYFIYNFFNPVARNYLKATYLYNPAEFFTNLTQEEALIFWRRGDHTVGYYNAYHFLQDPNEDLNLESLGIYAEVMEIRTQVLQTIKSYNGTSDNLKEFAQEQRQDAVKRVNKLIIQALQNRLPEDVLQNLFESDGSLGNRGNMIFVERNMSEDEFSVPLPDGHPWTAYRKVENRVFTDGSDGYHGLRLTLNHRAYRDNPEDIGFLERYLFPESFEDHLFPERHLPPQSTDVLGIGFYKNGPGNDVLSDIIHEIDQQGAVIKWEMLGNVPKDLLIAATQMGGYFIIPIAQDPAVDTRYHFSTISPRNAPELGNHDWQDLESSWYRLSRDKRIALLEQYSGKNYEDDPEYFDVRIGYSPVIEQRKGVAKLLSFFSQISHFPENRSFDEYLIQQSEGTDQSYNIKQLITFFKNFAENKFKTIQQMLIQWYAFGFEKYTKLVRLFKNSRFNNESSLPDVIYVLRNPEIYQEILQLRKKKEQYSRFIYEQKIMQAIFKFYPNSNVLYVVSFLQSYAQNDEMADDVIIDFHESKLNPLQFIHELWEFNASSHQLDFNDIMRFLESPDMFSIMSDLQNLPHKIQWSEKEQTVLKDAFREYSKQDDISNIIQFLNEYGGEKYSALNVIRAWNGNHWYYDAFDLNDLIEYWEASSFKDKISLNTIIKFLEFTESSDDIWMNTIGFLDEYIDDILGRGFTIKDLIDIWRSDRLKKMNLLTDLEGMLQRSDYRDIINVTHIVNFFNAMAGQQSSQEARSSILMSYIGELLKIGNQQISWELIQKMKLNLKSTESWQIEQMLYDMLQIKRQLHPDIHQMFMAMVYHPKSIDSEANNGGVVGMTLNDVFALGQQSRINIPGDTTRSWQNRLIVVDPVTGKQSLVYLEDLIAATEEINLKDIPAEVVRGVSLQKHMRAQRYQSIKKSMNQDQVFIGMTPDVINQEIRYSRLDKKVDSNPVLIRVGTKGKLANINKVELLILDPSGKENILVLEYMRTDQDDRYGEISSWQIQLQLLKAGEYKYKVQIYTVDGEVEESEIGELYAIGEEDSANPLDENAYFMNRYSGTNQFTFSDNAQMTQEKVGGVAFRTQDFNGADQLILNEFKPDFDLNLQNRIADALKQSVLIDDFSGISFQINPLGRVTNLSGL